MADWLAKVRKSAIANEANTRGRFESLADAHKADAANAEVMERHCREAATANDQCSATRANDAGRSL
jgi:hypothetical protein